MATPINNQAFLGVTFHKRDGKQSEQQTAKLTPQTLTHVDVKEFSYDNDDPNKTETDAISLWVSANLQKNYSALSHFDVASKKIISPKFAGFIDTEPLFNADGSITQNMERLIGHLKFVSEKENCTDLFETWLLSILLQ